MQSMINDHRSTIMEKPLFQFIKIVYKDTLLGSGNIQYAEYSAPQGVNILLSNGGRSCPLEGKVAKIR